MNRPGNYDVFRESIKRTVEIYGANGSADIDDRIQAFRKLLQHGQGQGWINEHVRRDVLTTLLTTPRPLDLLGTPEPWTLLSEYKITPAHFDPEAGPVGCTADETSIDEILRMILCRTDNPDLVEHLIDLGFLDTNWVRGLYGFALNARRPLFEVAFKNDAENLTSHLRKRGHITRAGLSLVSIALKDMLHPSADQVRDALCEKLRTALTIIDEHDCSLRIDSHPHQLPETDETPEDQEYVLLLNLTTSAAKPEIDAGDEGNLSGEMVQEALAQFEEHYDIRNEQTLQHFYKTLHESVVEYARGSDHDRTTVYDVYARVIERFYAHQLLLPEGFIEETTDTPFRERLIEKLPRRKRNALQT